MSLTLIAEALEGAGARLSRYEGQRDLLLDQRDRGLAAAAQHRDMVEGLEHALAILQRMEEKWRDHFIQLLSTIVSEGLTAVFEEPMEVILSVSTYRDATSIDLRLKQGELETDIMDAKGGSVVQALSYLLRVLFNVSAQPPLSRLLALDEPFGMVSQEYRARLGELVQRLRARLDMQHLIVTHEPEYVDCADASYVVDYRDNRSHIRALRTHAEEANL